jgi:hypothetical protein
VNLRALGGEDREADGLAEYDMRNVMVEKMIGLKLRG